MSSYDKVVKLACKPKAAPPKAKYIDPIIAATWSNDGAVHDVCKALSPRIREPNTIIVFKALIVLHTMIRNGATDNVLSYLSSSEVLRLRNISSGNWEGYATPQNLQVYALYLDSRIRAYKDLKHDAIRVQAESNRDMRNSASIEEDGYRGRKDRSTKPSAASVPTRSKTIMGRKLRSMTVEKGLLRETKVVHGMIDTLVECRFYLDDLEDELTTTALRMLVKDLLILFQAGNEGVINVLENYFEMSHVDATEALDIYRHFCKQTDLVVEYLGVAKKLQNLLNVPIPNLKHAPVSLAGALQEYLDDPNFEQNRIEYKTNKEAVERPPKSNVNGKKPDAASSASANKPSLSTSSEAPKVSTSQQVATSSQQGSKDIIDFFAAIDEEHPTTVNPQNQSMGYVQPGSNPFAMANGQNYQQPQVTMQPTGFIVPQQTAVPQPPNPFGIFLGQQQQQQQPAHRPFSSYLMSQPTGPQQPQTSGFPQSSQPGGNPFRQTILVPQSTGMALFGASQGQSAPNGHQSFQGAPISLPGLPFSQSPTTPLNAPMPSMGASSNNTPARPSSTPLTSSTVTSPPLQPVKSHQTGTKNPFGPITSPPPPVPKAPTLLELTTGVATMNGNISPSRQSAQQQSLQQQQVDAFSSFSFNKSTLNPGATDISSVASSFAFNSNAVKSTVSEKSPSNNVGFMGSQPTGTTATGSTFSDSFFSSLSQSTRTSTLPPSPTTQGSPPITSHVTGFGGLKPFIPSSSFGASLLESLPPVSGSGPTSPTTNGPTTNAGNGPATTPGGANYFSSSSTPTGNGNYSFLNSQPTGATGGFTGTSSTFGSSLGVGLRPQMTGGGAANPFRASSVGGPGFGGPAPFQQMGSSQPLGANMFGMTGAFGAQGQQPHGTAL
ncbi:ANTH-domain-containing protein [Phlegmacium glaucopus]|nr:ANTH-domain-containing protein [Phlegmacium glaucopus]